jgi:methylisocitrate lyase
MSSLKSAGARFRAAVAQERPLQAVGVINAYAARLRAGNASRIQRYLTRARSAE